MKITVAFAAAAACLALSGCNTIQTRGNDKPPPKLDCRSANACEVQVSVSCCNLEVDSYAVIISVKNGKDSISWLLPKDSSFTFAPNDRGVVFDQEGTAAFKKCKTEMDGRRFTCQSSDPNFGVYKYTINVVSPLGFVRSLDPWVINN